MAQYQQTIRTLKSFPLEDYVPNAGQVRDDLKQKLSTIEKSEFSVDFELLYEVHGGYDLGNEDNASLLVIRVVPKPDDLERQFLWFKVTLTVVPNETKGHGPDEDQDSVPLLASIEPASSGDLFADVCTTNETRETALKATLAAQIYAVTPGVEGSRTFKSEWRTNHWLRIKSGTERTNLALSKRKANRAWWEVRAANKEDGIGDSFTVALLVKRPKGSKFRVEAFTDGEIGILSEKLKKFVPSGLRSKKEPSLLDVFGPARASYIKKIPKGVNENNLHAASTDDVMKRIDEVGLHLQEQGRLVRYEEGMVGSNMELEDRTKPNDQSSSADADVSKKGAVTQAPVPRQAEQPLATTLPLPRRPRHLPTLLYPLHQRIGEKMRRCNTPRFSQSLILDARPRCLLHDQSILVLG